MAAARPSREERQKRIIELARANGSVRINALAESLDVTGETIRRDLDELSGRGLLHRTYGGAAALSLTREPMVRERRLTRVAERERIGRLAATLVEPGDAVFVDCGSTTTFFARALAARAVEVTVVTNCVAVAAELGAAAGPRILLCPGDYVAREGGVYGPATLEFLHRYTADKAFIGAGGLTEEGATDADTRGVWVKRAMLERSRRSILLVDRGKFGLCQFETIGALDGLDDLVCDAPPPPPLQRALEQHGVEIHEARAPAEAAG